MEQKLERLSLLVDELIDSKWTAGVALKITKNGKEIFKKQAGKQNLQKDIDVTNNTLFRGYSMTKPLTAVAFMHLLDLYNDQTNLKYKIKSKLDKNLILEKITVDTELRHLFKEWDKTKLLTNKNETIDKQITIGDVLTMTAGIPYANKDVIKRLIVWRLFGRKNMNGFAKTVAKIKLISKPNEKWNYSLSMDLIGAIGERMLRLSKLPNIKEKDWGSFVQNHILRNLGMNNSWYGRAMKQEDIDRIQITSITKENGEMFDATDFKDVKNINRMGWIRKITKNQKVPMGGNTLITSLEDYSKFQNFMLTGKNDLGDQIVKYETILTISENKLNNEQIKSGEDMLRPGFGWGYGMRVKVGESSVTPSIPDKTFGWDGMMCTLSLMNREDGICVCLMTSKMRPFSIKGQKSIYGIDEIYEIIYKTLLNNNLLNIVKKKTQKNEL